jgi:predicted CxxxxCH...CXXCH cytochrome family protein
MSDGGRAERAAALSNVALGGCLAAAMTAIVPSCLNVRDELVRNDDTACATCHGDPTRSGGRLSRAAPPGDLSGAVDPSHPGVGAHAVHLTASETHGAVSCDTCHVVPERTESPGHADDERPAEISFGEAASRGGRTPLYDYGTRSCEDTYCHGNSAAVWTAPRSAREACGTCHGLPPPAPHPSSDRCASCHGAIIDADRHFLKPELHVDGIVQLAVAGCAQCHGSETNPAPPADTGGNQSVTAVGVGAHQAHLIGGQGSRAVECSDCHEVPPDAQDRSHADGLPAEVSFGGVAVRADRRPDWDRDAFTCSNTWCHGPDEPRRSPSWVSDRAPSCPSCHGMPPAPPHPQMADCSLCHGAVVAPDDATIATRRRHVDGVVDVATPTECTACHGDENPAPPTGLGGNTATTAAGVGAHQTHVVGTERARAVPCVECHAAVDSTLAAGHLDSTLPAEVMFSGAATANVASPVYSGATCTSTPCHGAVFPRGHSSGGTNTSPTWTRVDGTEASCGACHGLPPPAPHPLGDLNPVCGACHENISPDNATFLRPDLHVNGSVTFEVP